MTTLYWLRYPFLLVLVAAAAWMVWMATAEIRSGLRRR